MKNKILSVLISFLIIVGVFCAFNAEEIKMYFPTNFSDVEMVYENTDDPSGRYYYNKLSHNAKIAYTLILPKLTEHEESIEIPEVSQEEFDKIIEALSYDNPEIICYGRASSMQRGGKKYYFYPDYTHTKEECESCRNELENAVNKALGGIDPNASEYEKELFVHDYICDICEYEKNAGDTADYRNAYDVFFGGKAVCEGYARATQLLLTRLGIYNYLVVGDGVDSGTGETIGHMWNIVRIDGKNYHLDVTWDDMDKSGSTISKSHMYFNLTDEKIAKNHFNIEPKGNNCVSTDANYYVVEGLAFDSFSKNIEKVIEGEIYKNYQNKNFGVEMCFTNEQAYNAACERLVKSTGVSEMIYNIQRSHPQVKCSQIEYLQEDDLYSLHFELS